MRRRAASGMFTEAEAFLADKAHAEKLLALAERDEANDEVRDHIARHLGAIEFGKLDLVPRLRALATNADARVRGSLASGLLFFADRPQGEARLKLALEIVSGLLRDPNPKVARQAATGLAFALPPSGCDAFRRLLGESKNADLPVPVPVLAVAAVVVNCDGLPESIVGAFDASARSLAAPLDYALGYEFGTGLANLCSTGVATDPVKQRAFDIAERLTDPKISTPDGQHHLPIALVACDAVRAKPILERLAASGGLVSISAKEALDRLKPISH